MFSPGQVVTSIPIVIKDYLLEFQVSPQTVESKERYGVGEYPVVDVAITIEVRQGPQTIILVGCIVVHGEELKLLQARTVQVRPDHRLGHKPLKTVRIGHPSFLNVLKPNIVEIVLFKACVIEGQVARSRDRSSPSVGAEELLGITVRAAVLVSVEEHAATEDSIISHDVREDFAEYLVHIEQIISTQVTILLVEVHVLEEVAEEVGKTESCASLR